MASQYRRNWPSKLPIWLLRLAMNIWPPYLGTGIHIKRISSNFRHVEVKMKMHWYNKNYVGTHFGGSMYAMTDPFYMLMLIRNLGRDYIVWDKAATINFRRPGRGTLTATFIFSEEEIQAIRAQADTNEKFVFDKPVDLLDAENKIVASVVKTLYVSKKRPT